jgi:hypothetical protein
MSCNSEYVNIWSQCANLSPSFGREGKSYVSTATIYNEKLTEFVCVTDVTVSMAWKRNVKMNLEKMRYGMRFNSNWSVLLIYIGIIIITGI